MAEPTNFESVQVTNRMPVPSHGIASSVTFQHFQVRFDGAGKAGDTVQFGDLPDYAVPVEVMVRSTAPVTLTAGIPADPDGLLDAGAVKADAPLHSNAGSLLGRNTGRGLTRVSGTLGTGIKADSVLDLFVFYVMEDEGVSGVGYPDMAVEEDDDAEPAPTTSTPAGQ